ncbi:MAG: Na-K-Cl cotransporter [Candidatus Eisenbacteria bacterium]
MRVAGSDTAPPPSFWVVFAVFFPAVTGIMAGLGLSGDLRDPIKSIPRGSLGAMLLGFVIYLAIPLVLVKAATPAALVHEPLIWSKIAIAGAILVLPGLWGAIFSSAVGSILGAPRTLQALAADGLAPRFFGRTTGKGGEPTVGLIVTLIIAVAAIGLGNLNAVAPVVSMFFLTVYGMVNLVAAMESLSGDSSWRPRLSIHWSISHLGAIGCFTVMFLINPKAAVAAIAVEILLWTVLERRERKARWGDIRRDVYEALIRWSLIKLTRHPMTPRNWRPHVLVFVDNAERRLDLIRFGTWFSQGRGVVTVCELVVGEIATVTEEMTHRQREQRIQKTLDREGLAAFGEVDIVKDVIPGITSVAQANGIAGLDSNTIVLGWPRSTSRLLEFLEVVKSLEHVKKSVIIARIQPGLIPRPHEERVIHVWWGGLERNGDLMLLLAHLITRNPEWRNSSIRIMSIASSTMMKERTEVALSRLVPAIRIDAEVEVTVLPKDRSVREVINERSADADLVFLGLSPPKNAEEMPKYAERLFELSERLRTVFFIKNSSLFVGQLVQTTEEIGATSE